ncbi:MAG: methyltransferase domain-containing protein [Rhizobiales bacterium]|nr:methyltransferase domain-containing protein [Hyphomicrobiales bacterium]
MKLVSQIALVFALALPVAAGAQQMQPLAPAGEAPATFPAPDRPVAGIVSHTWWTEQNRDAADEAGQLTRLMELKPGMTVADIGAGSGYDSVRLSPVVGDTGRIIAEDIMPEYLAMLDKTAKEKNLQNITLALGDPHDPRLQPGSIDAALMVHMYHEIEQPYAFLHNLAPALKPGAKVGVVDLDRPTENHGTPPALLKCEFEAVGYTQTAMHQLEGNIGYLAVFAPPAEGARPAPSAIKACNAG